MRTKGWIALVLAAVCGLLVAVRVQLHESRGPVPAVAVDVPAKATDHAASLEARAPSAELDVPADDDETAGWPYETLSTEERAVVDRGRDVSGWESVHRAFSDAAREDSSGR
jgi:hypothetical protein